MTGNKIVIADDHLPWSAQWGRVLDEHHPGKYEIEMTTSPEGLRTHLEDDPDVWVAVVDLDFQRASTHTGLDALLATQEHARRRTKGHELHTVVTTSEYQDDRILFLHTAFQCFSPQPVDLIYKNAEFDQAVLDTLGHLSAGGRPGPSRYSRFVPAVGGETLMRRLLGGKRNKDGEPINLALWRALSGIAREEDDAVRGMQRLEQATGLSRGHIYKYLDDAFAVASELAPDMRFPPSDLMDPPERMLAGDKLSPLREFACIHALFFHAPELRAVIEQADPVSKRPRSRR